MLFQKNQQIPTIIAKRHKPEEVTEVMLRYFKLVQVRLMGTELVHLLVE